MKSKYAIFLLFISISYSPIVLTQEIIISDSLNSLLESTNNPKEKVDIILKYLEKPENQYLEKTGDFAKRACEIAQQNNYPIGEIQAMIKLGSNYFRAGDYKKAMEFAQKSKEMAEDLNFDKELANSLILIGTIYNELGDYDNSSQYLFKGLKLFEKLNDKEGISNSIGNIGNGFYYQQDFKKALEYYNNALTIAIKINNQTAIKRQYNNIAAVYSDLQQYDTAIVLLRKALAISVKLNDKFGQGINIMNIGYGQMNRGKYSDALLSFQQSLNLFTELNNRLHMAKCYLNFGYCYFSTNRVQESIGYFKKALSEGQNQRYYKIISTAAKMLDQIYAEKKDTISAYKYITLEKIAGDSLFASQNQKILSKLELQYLYEKQDKELKLKQQKNYFILGFMILGLFSGIIIILLIYSRQRIKIKNSNLEKQKMTSDLNFKNKELTINLMALMKKNEMMSEISKKLILIEKKMPKDETRDAINKLNKEVTQTSDEKIWKEFALRFQQTNSDFYDKLLLKYPDLTQNELRLCAYLRLNMTSKEISELTGQRTLTLESARYRLRKKLGISGSDNNLVTFLSQI